MRRQTKYTDPRRVGGTYHSGYWDLDYDVISIRDDNGRAVLTVSWHDNDGPRVTTHATAWDAQRDRIISA